MQPIIEIKSTLEGIIKLEVIKEDGTLKEAEGLNVPFTNLITDAGLNAIGKGYTIVPASGGSACKYCRVGTSSTPPTVNDTTLGAQTGSENSTGSSTNSVQYNTTPYYADHTGVFTFNVGAVSGNLTEIGFFSYPSGGSMWSRALIKDSGGNPTVLTILPTEQLKVTYTVRRYIPTSITGSFTLNTNGTNSTINYTITPANMSDIYAPWYNGYCSITQMYMWTYETNILGSVTGTPVGTVSNSANNSPSSYISGSFYNESTITYPVTSAVFTTGIGSAVFWIGSSGSPNRCGYQCSFSPKIMKTASQTLAVGIRISWGRTTAQ